MRFRSAFGGLEAVDVAHERVRRGRASERSARRCQAACRRLGIEFAGLTSWDCVARQGLLLAGLSSAGRAYAGSIMHSAHSGLEAAGRVGEERVCAFNSG